MTSNSPSISFLTFWLAVNKIASQIEAGEDPRPLMALLRQHLADSLDALHHWQRVRWGPPVESA
jgi:hypothetical protein